MRAAGGLGEFDFVVAHGVYSWTPPDVREAALRAENPRLVYASVLGYGQDGPYAPRPAYDDLMQGATTVAALNARVGDGRPGYVPLAMVDRITGLAAVGAINAA